MRNEQQMMDLILRVAQEDPRIRAVLLVGSRAIGVIPTTCRKSMPCGTILAPFMHHFQYK
jgi:hypothetical protein